MNTDKAILNMDISMFEQPLSESLFKIHSEFMMKSTTKMELISRVAADEAKIAKTFSSGGLLHGRERTTAEWFQQEVTEFINTKDLPDCEKLAEFADVIYTGLVHLNVTAEKSSSYQLAYIVNLLHQKIFKKEQYNEFMVKGNADSK